MCETAAREMPYTTCDATKQVKQGQERDPAKLVMETKCLPTSSLHL